MRSRPDGVPSPSLRVRVAAAAASGTVLVVLLLTAAAFPVVVRDPLDALDQRLLEAARIVVATGSPSPSDAGLLVTVRSSGQVRSVGAELPPSRPGTGPTTVDGVDVRVATVPGPAPGDTVSVGAPEAPTLARVARRRRLVLLVALTAVGLAALLGWVSAGRAVSPLRRLTERARALPSTPAADAGPGRPAVLRAEGSRESEELAAALTELLARVERAQAGTREALATARDFAAAADHELRTPLTAMRTDIDVLREHPDLAERAVVLDDLARTQARVEATLTALGQLAAGDLGPATDEEAVELADLAELVAQDARRAHPDVRVTVHAPATVTVRGRADGLRLALDNLVTNAVRHGRARTVVIEVQPPDVPDGPARIVVDDDGVGLPPVEREAVVARFARGSTARGAGSGLGLALVAQQARRHGGALRLLEAPRGGVRAEIDLPAGG